jgi:hypothetical protein
MISVYTYDELPFGFLAEHALKRSSLLFEIATGGFDSADAEARCLNALLSLSKAWSEFTQSLIAVASGGRDFRSSDVEI